MIINFVMIISIVSINLFFVFENKLRCSRITATEAPSKIHQEKLINTNVFELNVVLMETLQCALGFESPACSGVSTPESSVNLPDRNRLTPNRSPPSMSPLASPALDTRASPLLVPDRNLPVSSPAPGRSIYSSRLSPLPPELMRKTEKRKFLYWILSNQYWGVATQKTERYRKFQIWD